MASRVADALQLKNIFLEKKIFSKINAFLFEKNFKCTRFTRY